MPPRVKPSNAKSTKVANGVEQTKISVVTDDDDAVSSTNITNEEPEQKLTKAKAKPRAKNAKAAAATSAPATDDDISEKKVTKATNGRSRKKLNVEEIESTLESMSTSPVPKSRGKKENLEKIQALLENDDGSVPDTNKSRKKKTTKDEVEKVSKPAARGRKKKEVQPSIEAADDVENVETVPEMKQPVKAVAARGRKKKENTPAPAPLEDAIEEPKKVAKKRANTKAKKDSVEADIEQPSPAKNAKPSKSEKTTKKSKKIVNDEEVKLENDVPSNGIATKRGQSKKTAPKDDVEDEPDIEVPEVVEKKSRARKRAAAVPIAAVDDESVEENDDVKPAKVKKTTKTATTKANTTETEYNKTDFELTNKDSNGSNTSNEELYNLKISSWNVAGLRSWLKKDGLKFLDYEEPDIFCMQEIKCTTDQLPEEAERIPGYHPYWLCMPGGYAGVAIYSKIMPINVEYGIGNAEFDAVGRIITAEYEKFFLINVYVPNSGRKLVNLEARMRWEQLFQEFIKNLDSRKPIVICGDMNVSHQEIDLANPKANVRNAGFTKEERDKMTELLALGFVDTFRHLYPDRKAAYTYWTYMANARSRNVGWRLDYFITSERFVKRVVDNCIRAQVKGSDHCPITLFLKM